MTSGSIVRGAAAAAVLAVAAAYAGPRLVDLHRLPRTIDASVASADRYNPGLEDVARIQGATLANMAAVQGIGASLQGLLATLAGTGGDMATVVSRVQRDLAAGLDPTGPALARLVASLGDLETRTRDLGSPLASSAGELGRARDLLAQVQVDAAALGASVRDGRLATDGIAANVTGR